MKSEVRHNLRTVISAVHIITQLVLLWLVFDSGASIRISTDTAKIAELYYLMSLFARMVAVFAIQFSLMKLLSNSHHSHQNRG